MRVKASGFTLIEVLVAFMILALSLTVLLRIFSAGLGNVALSAEYSEALLLAENHLASTGVSEPLVSGVTEGVWDERFLWQTIVEPYGVWEDVPNPSPPALAFHVKVRVEWDHKGRTREISLSSLRLKKQPVGGERG